MNTVSDFDTLFTLLNQLNATLDTLKTINHVYKDEHVNQYHKKIDGVKAVLTSMVKEQIDALGGVYND